MRTAQHRSWCQQPCDVDPHDGTIYHRTEEVALVGGASVQACLAEDPSEPASPVTVQLAASLDDELTLDQLDKVIAGLQAFRRRISRVSP